MIIPSIDLMGGNAVQLVGGKELKIDAGDPRPIAETFALSGEIAVVDLDAALGQGDNTSVINELLAIARCRVGGGNRSVEAATAWLDRGADRIVLGTAARPDVLKHLPADRVIAALDAVEGEVVVDGWRTKTGANIADRMRELSPYVGGFLVTFVEREGRLQGTDMERVRPLIEAANGRELTIAGGVTTTDEIAELDALGVHAQVGMALYSGSMPFGHAICAPLKSDRPDGLWPTIVCNQYDQVLGLVYSDRESIQKAVELKAGVYHSRKRGLWIKGESSQNTQRLLEISLDCDRDALKFRVEQQGAGFCHLNTSSCFGPSRGLVALQETIHQRLNTAPEGSYTDRLLQDPNLLSSKLLEEVSELLAAKTSAEIAAEAADLLYFTMVYLAKNGVTLGDVEDILEARARRVTRRPGNAKS